MTAIRAAARFLADVAAAWWVTARCWWELHRGGWYVLWLLIQPTPTPRPKENR